MKLTLLGKDPNSAQGECPSVYATDRGTLVVQGWKVTDLDAINALTEHGLPDTETAVEIPVELLRHFPVP